MQGFVKRNYVSTYIHDQLLVLEVPFMRLEALRFP